ncbi:MAG: hypothetical protein Q8K36_03625, partial [Alphaproteobacteria bacterium]|nr:hypothetical protein [Alphaproteobacteria bacterium]
MQFSTNNMFTSKAEETFFQRVYSKGIAPYVERLQQYKFEKYERILDAGCGYGQWSLALSQLNKEVYACDADHKRV